MTKAMATSIIKKKVPSWRGFNLLLKTVDLDDPIGHLFVVDIFYDHKNAIQKQKIYNKIYPPIIEKQKMLDSNERSVYQLIELYSETDNPADKDVIKTSSGRLKKVMTSYD